MSCLFNSLGKLLKVHPTTLRHQICDFIISKPDAMWDGTKISDWIQWVAGDQYKTLHQYIGEMRNLNKWGGAPEIAICCMLYDVAVEVLNHRDRSANVLFKDESQTQTRQSPQDTTPNVPKPPPTAPLLPNIVKPVLTQNDITIISTMWKRYSNNLHVYNPTLQKMSRFPRYHPLRKNYEFFINDKKRHFENKMIKQLGMQQAQQAQQAQHPPILMISWTGNHYEPAGIKNHHLS